MCDVATDNLIDLSIEEVEEQKPAAQQHLNENLLFSGINNETMLLPQICDFVSPQRRESFENNPFDMVQKLSTRLSDPFDMVEHQARQCTPCSVEVKEGNLLSLSNNEWRHGTESNYACISEKTPTQNVLKSNDNSAQIDSDSGGNKSVLNKKSSDSRQRLLKFSIANSTFNTPTGRAQSSLTHSSESGFSSEDQNNSPLSELFKSVISQADDHMLMSESPIKLVNDDLMSETPPNGQTPSLDTEFEADLEMLRIPMLKLLPSTVMAEVPTEKSEEAIESYNYNSTTSLLSLEMLRSKLRTQRLENKANSDISELINSLKSLICDSDLSDVAKKDRASNLLEMLSKTLVENKQQASNEQKQTIGTTNKNVLNLPASIKREGTFDLDLDKQPTETMCTIPESMVSSTATFDGDSAEDKAGLQLPEIYVEEHASPNQLSASGQQLDVNELVEQLSKLLGQHQINSTHAEQTEQLPSAHNTISNVNPTVIVVMNAPTPLSSDMLEHTFQQSEAETRNNSERAAQAFRRRSQSLSLLDNVKILQLPMTSNRLNAQETATARPADVPEQTENFKTPARMLRRNSYSNATPYTPINSQSAALRRSNIGIESLQKTRRLVIEQNQTSVKPARNALIPSRADFKKKQKTESIMKSAVPMKATIPLKKIAPTFKASPPSPSKNNVTHAQLDSSIHFLRANKIACTSTPMPSMQSLCTTPHVASPIRRSTLMKPRHSYLGCTPISKPAPTTPANLSRRNLNELRTKSPVKTRFSVTGSISKACANLRSTTMRSSQTTTSTSRMSALLHNKTLSRLRSPMRSNNIAPTVNKENKRP